MDQNEALPAVRHFNHKDIDPVCGMRLRAIAASSWSRINDNGSYRRALLDDYLDGNASFVAERLGPGHEVLACAALTTSIEPYLGRTEGVLAVCHAAATCSEETFREILDSVVASARKARCHALYAEAFVSEPAVCAALTSWSPYLVVLLKRLSTTSVDKCSSVRPAQESDTPWILDCLQKAFVDGLPPTERCRVSSDNVARLLAEQYTPVVAPDRLVLVRDVDNVGRGFCYLAFEECDVYTHQPQASLVNSYVMPGYRDRGISRELLACAETQCLDRGYSTLLGHLVPYATPPGVLPNLVRTGWSPLLTVYRLDLAAERG